MVALMGARDAHEPPRATPSAAPAGNRPVRRRPHRTRTPPIAPCRKAMPCASLREQPRVTTTTGRPSLDALARIRTETPCGTAPSRQRVYQFHHQGEVRKIEVFGAEVQAAYPKRFAARSRALRASSSRLRAGALIVSESIRWRAIVVTSSTARLNTASFACEGCVVPLNLRTNCSADARISSSVAGGAKFASVLMFLHIFAPHDPRP